MKLRALTYNIHKCIGGVDRRYQPGRIVNTIHHYAPDILLLQEVDSGAKRSSLHKQAEMLSTELGLTHFTWFPNVKVGGGGEYGNAIISRWPISSSCNIDLTVSWRKRRSALHAEIRVRHDELDRTVHVFNMHLGLAQSERQIQLARFLACDPFSGLHEDTPILVGGDFNDVYGGLGKLLVPHGFRRVGNPLSTFPAWAPLRALDSLYVRGSVDAHSLQRGETALAKRASDHRPLIAELEVR